MIPMNEYHPAFLSDQEQELSRRSFMKWMGAGLAVVGASLPACRRVEKYLVPYNQGPEWTIPGIGTSYASCMPWVDGCFPLLATCYEGRPTKLEPSFQYPHNQGLLPFVQASILEMYDPQRSQYVLNEGKKAPQEEWLGAFGSWCRRLHQGAPAAFILGENISPVQWMLCQELKRKNSHITFYSWEFFSGRNRYDALTEMMGEPTSQWVDFTKVKCVVSLDCDFLGTDLVGNIREYSEKKESITCHMAEGRVSLTGLQANTRLPIRPSEVPHLLLGLVQALGSALSVDILPDFDYSSLDLSEAESKWVRKVVTDLKESKGQSIVLLAKDQDLLCHQIVLKVNEALGAVNSSLVLFPRKEEMFDPIEGLLSKLAEEKIEMVFCLSGNNPVKETPHQWQLAQVLQNPKITSVHLGTYVDATAKSCLWHIPGAHYLESWGMLRDGLGRLCLMQPTMLPAFEAVSIDEFLLSLLVGKGEVLTSWNAPSNVSPVYYRVKKCFESLVESDQKEALWIKSLQAGFVAHSEPTRIHSAPKNIDAKNINDASVSWLGQRKEKGHEVQLVPDYRFYDGRFSRNAWLRECPDPVSGISWDTCAQYLAPNHEFVPKKPLPLFYYQFQGDQCKENILVRGFPSMPKDLMIVPVGGESLDDEMSQGDVQSLLKCFGQISTQTIFSIPASNWKIERLSTDKPIADAHPIWAGEGASETFGIKVGAVDWVDKSDEPCAWGMYIDLNQCIGCNACMVACRAENNIPVVGREQMAKGRGMDWIRIDKYFASRNDDAISLWSTPVACQQCGAAPCESVCPVNATVHTTEGLNAMVYGRCWGTRYCATNCPYKARRFNFFDYAKQSTEQTALQANPNVTVRSRGVMEKCTYCVQRLEEAKIRRKAQVMERWKAGEINRPLRDEDFLLPDGAVMVACQAACPMGAIHFGNRKDPASDLKKCDAQAGSGQLLAHLGTKPSTVYRVKQWL